MITIADRIVILSNYEYDNLVDDAFDWDMTIFIAENKSLDLELFQKNDTISKTNLRFNEEFLQILGKEFPSIHNTIEPEVDTVFKLSNEDWAQIQIMCEFK